MADNRYLPYEEWQKLSKAEKNRLTYLHKLGHLKPKVGMLEARHARELLKDE